MSLATECNFEPREYALREEIPITSNPMPFFSTGRPNASTMARFVGSRWAEIIDAVLKIEGVGAVEVNHWTLIVFKNHDLPWDHIDPAVQRLLP